MLYSDFACEKQQMHQKEENYPSEKVRAISNPFLSHTIGDRDRDKLLLLLGLGLLGLLLPRRGCMQYNLVE